MGKEIEKKFLLWENGESYATENLLALYKSIDHLRKDVLINGVQIEQGYLPLNTGKNLAGKLGLNLGFDPSEARLRNKADNAFFFTLKSIGNVSRNELEIPIEGNILRRYWRQTLGKRVEKVRLSKPYQGQTLEIDVYTDRDLIVAEIEVPTIEIADRIVPIGKDVTFNKDYKNINLAK